MLFTFLLVVHAIIAALLVTVILMQKSEGGGLTSGGSPAGFMSARGAADFLTRATSVLATLFIGMAILLAMLAATQGGTHKIDASGAVKTPVVPAAGQGQQAPPAASDDPLADAARRSAPSNGTDTGIPLAQ